ncbi:SDR family NAD(P)-dependent oxidoreductase [Serratia microhaemolytica]|uniref:SDR family NAD(P)-dependent oxidoreductase n=1 Tax=Serratia microhaemolytica TaxID=2675110 RepID=UPI000FDE8886|nr:SDR family NAD(P)-dependent oxidoreductase [Serratia microhaemolytica]
MSNQIAVVTGAAGGFGAAICKVLLQIGYQVAATDINMSGLTELAHQLGHPEQLHPFVMDVTQQSEVQQAAHQISSSLGETITLLVNNAGIIERGFCLSDNALSSTERVLDVNLLGTFNCTMVFSRFMARLNYGRIINIASIAGICGAAGSAAYAASKAGVISATESWGRELGPLNICVTAIAPGICNTEMLKQFLPSGRRDKQDEDKLARSLVPIGRWGTAEDVAEVVGFLASCNTNYLNTAVIPLDGGMHVGTL